MIWYYNSQPVQKNQECAVPLFLQGESDVTQYTADVSDWLALWPDSTVVVVLRPADGSAPYMADTSLNRETGIITWNITAFDTAIVGYGVGELRLVADNYVKKSYPFKTYVKASVLAAAGDPPAPVPDWVNEAIQQMQQSANAAQAAQQGAEAAQEAAETAQEAAETAQAATEQAAGTQIEAINTAGAQQIGSVQAEGADQVAAVQQQGAAQVASVQQKGEETLASIPDDYTELSGEVADLKSAFDDLQGGVISGLQNLPLGDLIPNRYITTAGNAANYSGWSATYFIEVPDGVKAINVTASGSSGSNYNAFYNSEKTFISNFAYQAGANSIAVPDNAAYVRLSGETSIMNTIALTFATLARRKLDSGFYGLNDVIKNSNPGYINIGDVGDTVDFTPVYSSSRVFGVFDVSQGDVFKITGAGGNASRLWCFADSNDVILSRSAANLSVTDLILTAPANGKLIINTSFRNYNIRKQLNDGGIAYDEAVAKAGYNYRNNGLDVLSAFNNVTCCGDSLTASVVYTHDNGDGTHQVRSAYKKYPWILGQKIGAEAESVATGGYTATDWWGAYSDRIIEKENHLIIIYLGTNGGLTDTLSTDAPGTDYSQYANTNTGNYCKMVAKSLEVGARVLLIKIHHGGGGDTFITNNVIDKIAEKFNVAVVNVPELLERKYHAFPDNTGINDLHLNDLGYAAFAEALIRNVGNLPDEMMVRLIPV